MKNPFDKHFETSEQLKQAVSDYIEEHLNDTTISQRFTKAFVIIGWVVVYFIGILCVAGLLGYCIG
jgi:hypothetical protein